MFTIQPFLSIPAKPLLIQRACFQITMDAGEKQDDTGFDAMTDSSNSTFRGYTPPTTINASDSLWSSRGAVPWPDNTFQIIEKESGKAIALVGDQPKLQDLHNVSPSSTHWHCVPKNGYFGFLHRHTGKYIGHDGNSGMRACASELNEWELWTPRLHPEGGYELLSPFWAHTLMILCVEWDGATLTRRWHGTTLWEFVKV